jgi:hypothetical protein
VIWPCSPNEVTLIVGGGQDLAEHDHGDLSLVVRLGEATKAIGAII